MWQSCALVFISSACTLIIELIAGRIMAAYVGVSLYTWTSIIGIVLAGCRHRSTDTSFNL